MTITFEDPTEPDFDDNTHFSTHGDVLLIRIVHSSDYANSNFINKEQARELVKFLNDFIND